MASRRMFSKEVVETDDFLDMPTSTRLLYYDLGMQCDDMGFVQPKRIMRMTGATQDDLKILAAKEYIIPFKSGVVVISHFKRNNYLQKDRIKNTLYTKELSKITEVDSVYKMYTKCIQNVSQYSIDKTSIDDDSKKLKNIIEEIKNKFPVKDIA